MTTEKKIIGLGVIITAVILVGAVILLSKGNTPAVPKDQIIAENGMHWHPKVLIYIKGEKQPFEDGIGLNGPVHNPIHTHGDADQDIVHMEFEGLVKKEDTKLAKFFQIWGKQFNSTQIFDKKNGTEGTVKMTVNGRENAEFENYKMRDGDMIEIKYE